MIRILNAEPLGYCEEARAVLRQVGEVVEAPLGRAELLSRLPGFDVLIVRLAHQVDQEMLDVAGRLKVIVSATTGLDHIDVDYANARNIAVLSLRGETAFLEKIAATGEHTWALVLSLLRRIPEASASVLAGRWDRDNHRGCELSGKRLGLVGLGRIGRQVARYGLAFRMHVSAYDPHPAEWVESVKRAPDLQALLRASDILSLHVPLDEQTTGLLGPKELDCLPEHAMVINTSRGELLDETALVDALASGHLSGAAVDVLSHEREPHERSHSPLLRYAATHNNLLITPHIGGATCESMARTEVFMARKLAHHLCSRALNEPLPETDSSRGQE
jgi:D-3-phosphoglycerate dehydrogenase